MYEAFYALQAVVERVRHVLELVEKKNRRRENSPSPLDQTGLIQYVRLISVRGAHCVQELAQCLTKLDPRSCVVLRLPTPYLHGDAIQKQGSYR